MLTPDQLRRILPAAGSRADVYAAPLAAAMDRFHITTPTRQAAFLAQIGHESGALSAVVENLNYSAEALARVWPARYAERNHAGKTIPGRPNALAKSIARKPEQIANLTYAGRMGNGDEHSGDGWCYRGRGLIQLTGRNNYSAAGAALKADFIGNPDLVAQPEYAALTAAWFWDTRGINHRADVDDFDGVSDIINLGRKTASHGDSVGFKDRLAVYERAKAVLV